MSRSMPSRRPASGRGGSPRPDTVKHYLETIYYIGQEEGAVRPGRIAEWLGVSAPTVSVTLRRLADDGWVRVDGGRGIKVTPKGAALAAEVVRVHRILERWLTDRLGLDWAAADAEAQRLASGVSPLVADRLDEHLGHPATCPHGNVIPGRRSPYGRLTRLSDLKPGVRGHVRRVSEVAEHEAPQLLRQLHAYGLVAGAEIGVAESDTSLGVVPVELEGQIRPLSTETAGLIWVEVS